MHPLSRALNFTPVWPRLILAGTHAEFNLMLAALCIHCLERWISPLCGQGLSLLPHTPSSTLCWQLYASVVSSTEFHPCVGKAYSCCHVHRVQPHVDNPLHPLSRALNCTPGWLAKFLLSPVPFFDFWATKSSFSSFRVPFLDFWAVAHMIFGYNPSIMSIYRELC